MSSPARVALLIAVGSAGVLGVLHLFGVGLKLLFVLALCVAVVTLVVPWIGAKALGDLIHFARSRQWAAQQGRFHSFGGAPLLVEDDGRHVWVDGDGYMRAVGRREPEDALAARLSGHWQRREDGRLMLRVDALVRHLDTMPGRHDPRVLRLRRYFERELLYPAARRRAQATADAR